ncbi:transglutaminase-like domain-containing protein [Actinokineospora fastidiosa]|uniref:Uncharacterized protein n=1 Tax=Actinokineospora fastidiosa TaxID=1816 RepID=A0A918GS05_9PSEU|nr:transglutaminase-like domain-containing protein [Actinokineospora fastidiosa]GGS54334.1 hypothetical protein GCM10010171_56820 [Actinokineospora fastidiosa]
MSLTRARIALIPGKADLVDAGMLSALFLTGLVGLATTYTGWGFLAVGAAGLVVGLVVGHAANVLGQPMIVVGLLTVAGFFLLGGALVLREQAVAGFLPDLDTVHGLAEAAVGSWKELLTTLPPVDGVGPLLVIPYILGLCCGSGGLAMARRSCWTAAPLLAPLLVLVAVVLLGTARAPLATVVGGVFAVLALLWCAIRAARRTDSAAGGASRVASASGLVLIVSALAAVAAPLLPGTGGPRTVLRDFVEPPLDVRELASPLVGFRKYSKDANHLWDQELLRADGLPPGAAVRIATLDDYNGSVWTASAVTAATAPGQPRQGFQRIGRRIPTTSAGAPVTVRITVGAAYAATSDLNAWLPTAGEPSAIAFTGERTGGRGRDLRYNLATRSAIVVDHRLGRGETYTVDTLFDTRPLPEDPVPFGPAPALPMTQDLVSGKTAQWAGDAVTIGQKVRAVAAYLRDNGAYSDGGPGEVSFLPGHSLARLDGFFRGDQPVGDDEQYAAAFALAANSLGMPARVVFGAVPGADGVVRGEHVHAWVELHLADGTWATVPTADFTPDKSKKPNQRPPTPKENTEAAVVPPPNVVRQPSSLSAADLGVPVTPPPPPPPPPPTLPEWLVFLLTYVLPPLAAIAGVHRLVLAAKAVRARNRRTRGSPAQRLEYGWRELLDRARDLGAVLPGGLTRTQQAAGLTAWAGGDQRTTVALTWLADTADRGAFGPAAPPPDVIAQFWAATDTLVRGLRSRRSVWRRLRADVWLGTFLPHLRFRAPRVTPPTRVEVAG